MSEFSESYHIRSNNQQDGVDLLKNANLRGAVFAPVQGWVTVVPESELYEAVETMAGLNMGIMLHYLYAEDHGWQFKLFKKSEAICEYECGWDPDFFIKDDRLDKDAIMSLITNDAQSELDDILQPSGIDAIIAKSPAYRFAHLIGLEHYEWLSGGYLDDLVSRDSKVIIMD